MLVVGALRVAVPVEFGDRFLQALLVLLRLLALLVLLAHHVKCLLLRLADFAFALFTLSAHIEQKFFGAFTRRILSFDVLRQKHALLAHLLSVLGILLLLLLLLFEQFACVLFAHPDALVSQLVILDKDDHHVSWQLLYFLLRGLRVSII